jgi:hypothetical protein
MDAVLEKRPHIKREALERTRSLMDRAVPDCLVHGHEALVDGLVLPDPDDRHVLAAAIKAGAQTIVTANLQDFPPAALAKWNIEAQHPDDFVVQIWMRAPSTVPRALSAHRSSSRR